MTKKVRNNIICPYCGVSDQVEIFEEGNMADDYGVQGIAPYTGGIVCHTCEKRIPTWQAKMSRDSFNILYEQLWDDFIKCRESWYDLMDKIVTTKKENKELKRRRDLVFFLMWQIDYAEWGESSSYEYYKTERRCN